MSSNPLGAVKVAYNLGNKSLVILVFSKKLETFGNMLKTSSAEAFFHNNFFLLECCIASAITVLGHGQCVENSFALHTAESLIDIIIDCIFFFRRLHLWALLIINHWTK